MYLSEEVLIHYHIVLKMVDMELRCPTGIDGLDKLLSGGFPRDRSMLLSGTCGTGKTTLGVQFLYNGILRYNEPGILVTLEQNPVELKRDMLQYGFDLQKVENENKLVIIDVSLSRFGSRLSSASNRAASSIPQPVGSMSLLPDEFNMDRIMEIIISKAKRINARRVVVDSLPALDFLLSEDESKIKNTIRQTLLSLNYRLKMEGLTTLLITEIQDDGVAMSAHGVESYVVDGVIVLHYISLGTEAGRSLMIRKMRATKHSEDVHPLKFIGGEGIRVLEADEIYEV